MYDYASGELRFELLRTIDIPGIPAINGAVILEGTGKISRLLKTNNRMYSPCYLPFVSRCDKPHLSK
jgi:hypothetical protein